jgi:hypothetical protein
VISADFSMVVSFGGHSCRGNIKLAEVKTGQKEVYSKSRSLTCEKKIRREPFGELFVTYVLVTARY